MRLLLQAKHLDPELFCQDITLKHNHNHDRRCSRRRHLVTSKRRKRNILVDSRGRRRSVTATLPLLLILTLAVSRVPPRIATNTFLVQAFPTNLVGHTVRSYRHPVPFLSHYEYHPQRHQRRRHLSNDNADKNLEDLTPTNDDDTDGTSDDSIYLNDSKNSTALDSTTTNNSTVVIDESRRLLHDEELFSSVSNDNPLEQQQPEQDSKFDDLLWRVAKLRLEEQNTQRFLKAKPRFLPYEECRKWVQGWGRRWACQQDWEDWIAMGEKRNSYIPVSVNMCNKCGL